MHERPFPPMTCACLYDGTTKYELLFYRVDKAVFDANAATLLRLLDESERLAGYNAICFDLPYIGRVLGVNEVRVASWKAKCIDPYIGVRCVLNQSCKLQKLLDINGLASKTGSGSDAIGLARDGRLQELLDYCMNDVLVTHSLCLLAVIRVTDTQGIALGRAGRWEERSFEAPPVPQLADVLTPAPLLIELAGDFDVVAD